MPGKFRLYQTKSDPPVLVGGKTIQTTPMNVPGIATGAAYTSGDAMGVKFRLEVPRSGIIQTGIFYDKDDEGLEVDLFLANADFTGTADNGAFDLSDVDLIKTVGVINFVTFRNFNSNQVSTPAALGLAYVAPRGYLWCQFIARSAPNIAASNIPMISLVILSDE